MPEIIRYVTVDERGLEGETEYATLDEAIKEAESNDEQRRAVLRVTYEYSDSVLAWTPDGSAIWPGHGR